MVNKNLPKVFIRWHCPVCKKEQDQYLHDALCLDFPDSEDSEYIVGTPEFSLWCVDCQKHHKVEGGYE